MSRLQTAFIAVGFVPIAFIAVDGFLLVMAILGFMFHGVNPLAQGDLSVLVERFRAVVFFTEPWLNDALQHNPVPVEVVLSLLPVPVPERRLARIHLLAALSAPVVSVLFVVLIDRVGHR